MDDVRVDVERDPVRVRVIEEDAPQPRRPAPRTAIAAAAVLATAGLVLFVVLRGGDPEARIRVLNGTAVPGLEDRVAAQLARAGFAATAAGDASALDLRRTRVVAVVPAFDETARELRGRLHALGAARL